MQIGDYIIVEKSGMIAHNARAQLVSIYQIINALPDYKKAKLQYVSEKISEGINLMTEIRDICDTITRDRILFDKMPKDDCHCG